MADTMRLAPMPDGSYPLLVVTNTGVEIIYRSSPTTSSDQPATIETLLSTPFTDLSTPSSHSEIEYALDPLPVVNDTGTDAPDDSSTTSPFGPPSALETRSSTPPTDPSPLSGPSEIEHTRKGEQKRQADHSPIKETKRVRDNDTVSGENDHESEDPQHDTVTAPSSRYFDTREDPINDTRSTTQPAPIGLNGDTDAPTSHARYSTHKIETRDDFHHASASCQRKHLACMKRNLQRWSLRNMVGLKRSMLRSHEENQER